MGVKNLWSVLGPYAEQKPISELRGKTVAIDLAGWVCESLNVVDYFVHPRHHLKNLFFRTCYLIWEEVTPVFIMEGVAPRLKSQVIEKRSEIQFRGVKPKETQRQTDTQQPKGDKNRTNFNLVLKQCETLLQAMGFQCMQGPGEAEAYCAFLNSKGLVDGVISQDSDCFAYGALRVYRNFSVSSQGASAAQGGAVDIYDINNICSKMDFGQNKVIVMALLCGCDYCPDGIGGVGRDSVLKLFKKYNNDEILNLIRSWRHEEDKYSVDEMRVDDKTICSNCGHIGRTPSHMKNGCGICRTNSGCDESLWKEKRLALKAELVLRKKALANSSFPSEEIINEFLKQPKEVPKLQLNWRQPNMVKFIKQIGNLLQWPEIYCFQKFLPILTRWQVLNAPRLKNLSTAVNFITPKEILKKRIVKGVPSLELLWQDENKIFNGLIPDSQLKELIVNNPKGTQNIWSTIEPFEKVKIAYPCLVELFLKSKEKSKKIPKKLGKSAATSSENQHLGSLENLIDLKDATKEIAKSIKPKRHTKCNRQKGLQMIDQFFKEKINNEIARNNPKISTKFSSKFNIVSQHCSTPITKSVPSDLESDIDEDLFDMSDIVNGIVGRSYKSFTLTSLRGNQLCYEALKQNTCDIAVKTFGNVINKSVDDFEIPGEKRSVSNSFCKSTLIEAKRFSLDDSFDVLVKKGSLKSNVTKMNHILKFVDGSKQTQFISENWSKNHPEEEKLEDENVSYFFSNSFQLDNDVFEKVMERSINKQQNLNELDDFIILSD